MAEFSNQDVGSIQNPITPKAPVVDSSSVHESQAISTGIQGLVGVASGIADSITTSNNNKAVAAFSQQQLALADAVDQGLISSQAARTRMRANFVAATSSSPGLTDKFAGIQKEIVSTAGLGKVIAEGTEAEKNQIKLINEAESIGFGRTQEGLQNYIEFKSAGESLKRVSAELSLQKSRNDLEQSNLKNEASTALANFAKTGYPAFVNNLEKIRTENPTATGAELTTMYTAEFAKMQFFANDIGAAGGQDAISGLLKPYQTTLNNYIGNANGSLTKADLDNTKANAITQAELNVLALDDELRNVVAFSSLFNHNNLTGNVIREEVSTRVLEKIRGLSKPEGKVPNITNEEEEDGFIFESTKSVMKSLGLGKGVDSPEDASAEVGSILDNINKSVVQYEGTTDSLKDFKPVISFYASSEYGKYASANGPAKDSAEALAVLSRNYSDVLIPLITEELSNNEIFLLTPRPVTGFVSTEFVNGALRFRATSNPKDPNLADKGRLRVQSEVKRLNRVVAGPINEIIRASAHINGNQNYQKVWDEELAPALGISTEPSNELDELTSLLTEEDGSSTNPKEINLEDFVTDPSIDPDTNTGKAQVSAPVLDALVEIESGGDPDAVSSAGARGVAQIMPHTAGDPGFGLPPIDLDNSTPQEQKAWAGRYLGKLKQRYKGNQAFALAAYNWGIGNVDKWIKKGAKFEDLPKETQNYLQQFQDKGVLHGKQ